MAIIFDKQTSTFYLEGKSYTYAFFINGRGYAEHLYFGNKIGRDPLFFSRLCDGAKSFAAYTSDKNGKSYSYNSLKAEITFFGNSDYREPTVCVEAENGDRLTELLYSSHTILKEKPQISAMPSLDGGETLVLTLEDKIGGLAADLYYTVYEDTDVIARRIVYRNIGQKKLKLDRAYSFCLPIVGHDYDVLTLRGSWARERTPQYTPVHIGVCSIDSKRSSSSAVLNPFMALCEKGTTENHGEVFGVSLVYSSSFVLKAEAVENGVLNILGGINDFGFSWTLDVGCELESPEAVIAYSAEGLGGMSRAFHDAFRDHLINKRFVKKSRPVVINNWEGTYFNFDNEKLKAIASAVANTGIDTFVLDDGWFGKRNDDRSGLGDWFVNTEKLEGGLKAIIDHVHSLGMRFGLWFEPEMISEDSEIFRAHPDYAIGVPGRERCYSRYQYMMDITRPDVRDYIVESVTRVLRENEIDYVKWDYNRNVTEFYSLSLPADRQGEFSHRYALGLYELCERIVEANPKVFFEGCSGGGSRFDPAMLKYFSQIWTSDDSDAEERTRIQYGTSIVYPLSSMSCHVSVTPNHQTGREAPMKTRADIAHLGATGYELDTSAFNDEDRVLVKAQIDEYKEMESLVLEGDLYRLLNPFDGEFFAFMLVSKDKSRAEMTIYRRMGRPNESILPVKPLGLDSKKQYYVPELGVIVSGSTLMNVGIIPKLPKEDFVSYKLHFEEK